jgi:tRNA A-37 threonylcarbamoyl transferase component Bud32
MFEVDCLRVDPAYRAALAACGLDGVDRILAYVNGRVAAWSRTTDTTLAAGLPNEPGFYIKRYLYPTRIKRIRTMLRGTFLGTHRGQAEYRALENMRAAGISAVRPVAFGARRIAHFVTACFLVTEEVPEASNLTTFAEEVASGRRALSVAARQAMIDTLADQVSHMHGLGFSHGQLFWRNILIRMNPDQTPEFFFLDLAPRRWRRMVSDQPWWQRELSHLAVSALPFTTRSDRLRFLRRYFKAPRLTRELKTQAREVAAGAGHWQRHETQRIKMNRLFDEWNRQLLHEQAAQGAAAAEAVKPGNLG